MKRYEIIKKTRGNEKRKNSKINPPPLHHLS